MPFRALDVPTMSRQHTFKATLSKRPYPNTRIIASSSEALVIRAKTDAPDSFLGRRPSPSFQVVHVRVKVFDDAALVCRYQEGAGVVEFHGADGRVVCLEDGFKVEG